MIVSLLLTSYFMSHQLFWSVLYRGGGASKRFWNSVIRKRIELKRGTERGYSRVSFSPFSGSTVQCIILPSHRPPRVCVCRPMCCRYITNLRDAKHNKAHILSEAYWRLPSPAPPITPLPHLVQSLGCVLWFNMRVLLSGRLLSLFKKLLASPASPGQVSSSSSSSSATQTTTTRIKGANYDRKHFLCTKTHLRCDHQHEEKKMVCKETLLKHSFPESAYLGKVCFVLLPNSTGAILVYIKSGYAGI